MTGRVAPAVATLMLLSACSGRHLSGPDASGDGGAPGSADGGSEVDAGKVPDNHRSSATTCQPRTSIVPDGGFAAGGECMFDSDCDGGPGTLNGRCIFSTQTLLPFCTYDMCVSDQGCSDGGVCQCADPEMGGNSVCLPANCRVDADCGPGGYCSAELGGCGTHVGYVGYYCHTPQDECQTDADCTIPGLFCVFDMTGKMRWVCGPLDCTG